MTNYDNEHFDPPAPVAEVTIRNGENRASVSEVPLLIDSGADITLIPRRVADQLGISPQPDQQYELMGFDGSRSFAPVVILDMIFSKRVFRGPYLLIEEDRGVLGRDVLNHIALLLDGPGEQWEVQ